MYLPTISGASPQKVSFDAFGGLNRSYSCGDSEFSDMENMTGEDYPCISVRPKREALAGLSDGTKLDFIVADNERGDSYSGDTGIALTEDSFRYYYRGEEKQVFKCFQITGVHNNSTLDDNMYINYPIGNRIEGVTTFGQNVLSYPYPEILNKTSGTAEANINYIYADTYTTSQEARFNKSLSRGEYAWGIDFKASGTYSDPYLILRHKTQYPSSANVFDATNDFENTYCIWLAADSLSMRNPYHGMHSKLTPGMRIRLEEYHTVDGNKVFSGNDLGAAFFVVLETEFLSNYILVRGYRHDGTPLVDENLYYECDNSTMAGEGKGLLVTILKADVNHLVSFQNRLWGTDTLGTSIYCSNATDIYNWEIDGTDAGGGFVDVPENTPWTALVPYNGYLYAFKANKMYKIMGNTALDYAAISICEIGCTNHEAVCIADSVLYFLSEDGVYGFTGNLPVKVSDALAESYVGGRLAADSGKLYACLEKQTGGTEFLVYDTQKRMWHKEDNFSVRCFANYAGKLYALGEDRVCYELTGGSAEGVPFSLTTKKYFYVFLKKAVSYVNLYLDTEGEDAKLDISVSYDGGEFETVLQDIQNRRVKVVPVRLRKCDTFQFKLSGIGQVRLKQMEFVLHTGGVAYR